MGSEIVLGLVGRCWSAAVRSIVAPRRLGRRGLPIAIAVAVVIVSRHDRCRFGSIRFLLRECDVRYVVFDWVGTKSPGDGETGKNGEPRNKNPERKEERMVETAERKNGQIVSLGKKSWPNYPRRQKTMPDDKKTRLDDKKLCSTTKQTKGRRTKGRRPRRSECGLFEEVKRSEPLSRSCSSGPFSRFRPLWRGQRALGTGRRAVLLPFGCAHWGGDDGSDVALGNDAMINLSGAPSQR